MKELHLIVKTALLLIGLSAGAVSAQITGTLTPNSISNVQAFGSTQTYTLDYSVTVNGGASGKADVMFLTDRTGSMGGYIEDMKIAFGGILSRIATDLGALDVHYGVADYQDYLDGPPYGGDPAQPGVNVGQTFTSDASAAQAAINSLTTGYGYDWPEEQLKSMEYVADNWLTTLSGRADAQKILIWGGDSPGHFFGEAGPYMDGPSDWYPSLTDTIDALNAQGIKVFGLNVWGDDWGIDDSSYDEQEDAITAATGGTSFYSVGRGGGSIEDIIVGAITGGVTTLTNITVSLLGDDGDFVVAPWSQTWIGSWTDTTVTGPFFFDALAPMGLGSASFDYVLLGNGALLDSSHIELTTVPVPGAVLLGLLGLGFAGARLRRFA